ncbi:LamG-like jellyroll fold domain-containing protein [Neolewinella antarctica]|uniref:Gliding motility-associated-like protein n=1 Tax=Neolewinella antarctica TaxID=442734 RepID=A0ABX0X9L9_9BACT|nr:LamG-like jellyroll fold domain-containing protein [Neolewinella antarctica]NJC25965.1 gliding motility-associated-like protein [Neolewinella antarctica]
MRIFSLLVVFFAAVAGAVEGQGAVDAGLTAFYTFDGNLEDGTGTGINAGVSNSTAEFGCGVDATALFLSGDDDFVTVAGGNTNNVNRIFGQDDFTVGFYFKPTGASNTTQFLITKRDTNCTSQRFFAVRYAPVSQTLSVTLRQDNQQSTIDYLIGNASCWQHVTVVRANNNVRVFLNAEQVGQSTSTSRIDVTNDGELTIGSSTCRNNGERSFEGLIDELRIYNRAFTTTEVASIYAGPDRIQNVTRRLFLGESVEIEVNSNCGTAFDWLPATGVDGPTDKDPIITPETAGTQTYVVSIENAESSCVAMDSISLQVIDPAALDCSEVFFPTAFTPNGIGPAANETFGISNPFAVPDLLSFEIYDRYGARMFQSTDAFARWDGSFKGKPVEPGVAVWRIAYECKGVEEVLSGSVMVLR